MKKTIEQILEGEEIKTNDLQKGDFALQPNGWFCELWDNTKGNTRVCNVHGFFTEAGSVYSHDIAYFLIRDDHKWFRPVVDSDLPRVMWNDVDHIYVGLTLTHTKSQLTLKRKVEAWR